jgi:GDP-4-dehydro-6-deoxy-D-mannose reductase
MSAAGPILVTGARGFVAAYLIADLLADGARVVGLDRSVEDLARAAADQGRPAGNASPVPPASPAWPWRAAPSGAGTPREVDLRGEAGAWTLTACPLEDAAAVAELVARLRPAAVFHLAAQSSAAVSFADPAGTFAANAVGSLNLLEAVRALPAAARPPLLAIGSAEEYGVPSAAVPLTERSPLRPVSPYGVSKAAQTMLALAYHRAYGLPVVVARPFSHTGPGQDARFVFPSLARQIAAAERERAAGQAGAGAIAVGDLSPVRDYLDVRDVVRAYRLLLAQGRAGQVYNVSSGQPLTIRQGLDILLAAARHPCAARVDPARLRPADIPYLVGDAGRLRADTRWRPERDITTTLQDLLAWARKEST